MASASERLNADIVSSVLDAAEGHPIVVALGGGADSAVLLAAAVQDRNDPSDETGVRAVFVRHGLPTSDLLEKSAIGLASKLRVPLSVLDAPVDDGPDLESRARAARYSAIEADLGSGELAMTAHTLDDQAETVVMRLARGSGSGGLSGIPGGRGPWRRPLLGFSKDALRAEAISARLPYADDPSNDDVRFTRTRIRHTLMPALEAELPGSVRDGLARSATLLASDDAYLAKLARSIPVSPHAECVRIAAAPLAVADRVVASRAVRLALRDVLCGYPGESSDVDAVIDVASDGVSRTISRGLTVVNEGPWVRVGEGATPGARIVAGEGDRFIWGDSVFRIEVVETVSPLLAGGRFTSMSAVSVSLPLEFRAIKAGDTVDTGEGNSPVVEVLRTHGVHADLRRVSLVAVDNGKIAAVVGVRTASWAAPHTGEASIIVEREVTT